MSTQLLQKLTVATLISLAIFKIAPASAATFEFEGFVNDYDFTDSIKQDYPIDLNAVNSIQIGIPIKGSYTFNDNNPLLADDFAITAKVGEFEFTANPGRTFGIQTDPITNNLQYIFAVDIEETNNKISTLGTGIPRMGYSSMTFQFAPTLSKLGNFYISGRSSESESGSEFYIHSDITSLKKVPEPTATLTILGLGVLGGASVLKKKLTSLSKPSR